MWNKYYQSNMHRKTHHFLGDYFKFYSILRKYLVKLQDFYIKIYNFSMKLFNILIFMN